MSHNRLQKIRKLKHGDELIIRDVWGAIEYKGEGYSLLVVQLLHFAILRQLQTDDKIANNKLILPIKPKKI
jgi:hypothetical protein